MATQGYSVDEAAASRSITAFYDAADEMRAIIRYVAGAVDNTGNGWWGDARKAFFGGTDHWGDGFSKLLATLDDLTDRSGTAVGTLTTAEKDNIAAVTSYTTLAH
ncbi:WXG100 family type VII secretion target [Nocardia sp. NBC_00416]|uniref:WXG100 family type VII secretion target n=1 Tax=Nocardia sp. NBC_00416 TaxID=2975991 RepID=UPI002E1AA56D